MKIALRNRIGEQYLKKADEIKVDYRDIESLPDLFKKFPEKNILLTIWFEEPDWEKIKEMYILSRGKMYLAINNWSHVEKIKKIEGLEYFFSFPINTPYYFNLIIKHFNVKYIRISAPLFFNMDFLKPYADKIRLIPNVALTDMPQANGLHGSWIRPEDLELYKNYCAMIEFEIVSTSAEEALYRIYCEEKKWAGELQLIIEGFNHPGVNRMLNSELTKTRMNCQQKCESGSGCLICERALRLANPELIKSYVEEKNHN